MGSLVRLLNRRWFHHSLTVIASYHHPLNNRITKNLPPSRSLSTLLSSHQQSHLTNLMKNGTIKISEEVSHALNEGQPVVSLETTIVTHGMPHPHNIQTAREVEDIIRNNGCVPATVGVIDGVIYVGLEKNEMERLGSGCQDLVKISRRDFPVVLSRKQSGGTTVSGTMLVSHLVGIQIFATGGIGGVHRGVEQTMDISADLTELGRTPVVVVSAGVKSILDIEKTLEYLETQGVCVATFGKDKDFPAFFVPSSGLKAPYNITDETEAAKMIYSNYYRLKLDSGMLIGVPIPDQYSTNSHQIDTAIQTAIQETREKRIQGKEVTPYILKRVNQLTGGESLQANIALIKNNADIGSKIAWQLHDIIQQQRTSQKTNGQQQETSKKTSGPGIKVEKSKPRKKRPVVIGGAVVDFNIRLKQQHMQSNGSTNPGRIHQSFGGVGRNMADCLSRLGANPLFISTIGKDCHTNTLLSYCQHMDVSGIRRLSSQSTATYCAVMQPTGQLQLGIGDMDIHQLVTPQMVCEHEDDIKEAAIVILDGNISSVTIETACDISSTYNIPVLYEPTDLLKASKPFESSAYRKLTYTSPNVNELQIMSTALTDSPISSKDLHNVEYNSDDEVVNSCLPHCLRLVEYIPVVIVTLGKHGVLLCHKLSSDISIHHYPALQVPTESIVSVSGAGDCFVSAYISGVIQDYSCDVCVHAGLHAAELSLLSSEAIPSSITPELFQLSSQKLSQARVIKWTN